MTTKTVFTGYDTSSVPRVYGEHADPDIAESRCRDEAAEYVKHRPDTGPLSRWAFTRKG